MAVTKVVDTDFSYDSRLMDWHTVRRDPLPEYTYELEEDPSWEVQRALGYLASSSRQAEYYEKLPLAMMLLVEEMARVMLARSESPYLRGLKIVVEVRFGGAAAGDIVRELLENRWGSLVTADFARFTAKSSLLDAAKFCSVPIDLMRGEPSKVPDPTDPGVRVYLRRDQ